MTPTRHADVRTVRYGADPSNVADLHLPADEPRPPVVVVVHGGFWRAQYGRELGTPLAVDLVAHGVAAWNVEYRRVAAGGGWPETLLDVAAAVDALADLTDVPLDLDRVVAVGHSAGGQLAVWAAGRHRLPDGAPGASPRLRLTGAVSQAGVLDLDHADARGLGGGAAAALLGGSAGDVPDRYAAASPYRLVPLGVPVVAVHGDLDDVVPFEQSSRYVERARSAGDDADLVQLPGVDHGAVIDVEHAAWAVCRHEVLRLLQ